MLKLTPQPDFNDHLFGQSIGGEFENKLPSIDLQGKNIRCRQNFGGNAVIQTWNRCFSL